MKTRAVWALVFALGLQIVSSAGAQADDSDEIRPRGYSGSDTPEIKTRTKNGPTELTVNYPEDARGFVNSVKMMLLKKHHKGSFKQTGQVWTLTDETDKKSWIIKTRHTTARKKTDMRVQQTLAAIYPNNASIQSVTSRMYEEQKKWPEAMEYYRKACALERSSGSVEDLVAPAKSTAEQSEIAANCAYYELMMGHYDTAVKQLTKAIELEPEWGSNYKNRAGAYRKLHKPDLAAQDEKKLQDLQSKKKLKGKTITKVEPRGSTALLYVKLGMYDQAMKTADEMLAKNQKSGLAHLMRGRTLVRLGKYQQALSDYRAVIEATKDAPSAKAEMAVAERLAKQGPAPYGDVSLLAAGPDNPLRKYAGIQNGKKVVLSVAQLAADHKGDNRVYSAICSVLKKRSMWKPLDIELDKVLAIDPDGSNTIGMKIETEEALLHWPEAEKYCNRYLTLLANGSVSAIKLEFIEYVYTVRALARRAQKNYAGAIIDEDTLLRLEPDSAEVFRDRGDCYLAWGNFDQAANDFTTAIQKADTKSGDIYLRRAKAFEKLKKPDLARQDRDMAAKLNATADTAKPLPD